MQVGRRWYWLGAALVVAGGVLVAGVPLGTLLTIAALLACPAAMYFGMGMMGRPGASQAGGDPAHQPGSAQMYEDTALLESPPPGDPLTVLKLRLAKGDITLEEYERLAVVLAGPGAVSQRERRNTAN